MWELLNSHLRLERDKVLLVLVVHFARDDVGDIHYCGKTKGNQVYKGLQACRESGGFDSNRDNCPLSPDEGSRVESSLMSPTKVKYNSLGARQGKCPES